MSRWIDILKSNLQLLQDAKNEREVRTAFLTAAESLVEASNSDDDETIAQELHSVESPYLAEVINRAISFRAEGKHVLGLFFIPVALYGDGPLQDILPLSSSLLTTKLEPMLLRSFGLMPEDMPKGALRAMPCLVSSDVMEKVSFSRWIDYVTYMQEAGFLSGKLKPMDFGVEPSSIPTGKETVFLLPVVVNYFESSDIPEAVFDERAAVAITRCIMASLPEASALSTDVTVLAKPQTYAESAQFVADRERKSRIYDFILHVRDQSGVAPAGMVALVGTYDTKSPLIRQQVVGLTLTSRLTGATLETCTFLDDDVETSELAAQIGQFLRDAGVGVVVVPDVVFNTGCCQHCGQIQFSLPTVEYKHSETLQ